MALLFFSLIISHHLKVLLQKKRDDCLDGLESMHMRFAGVGKRPTWQARFAASCSQKSEIPIILSTPNNYPENVPVQIWILITLFGHFRGNCRVHSISRASNCFDASMSEFVPQICTHGFSLLPQIISHCIIFYGSLAESCGHITRCVFGVLGSAYVE